MKLIAVLTTVLFGTSTALSLPPPYKHSPPTHHPRRHAPALPRPANHRLSRTPPPPPPRSPGSGSGSRPGSGSGSAIFSLHAAAATAPEPESVQGGAVVLGAKGDGRQQQQKQRVGRASGTFSIPSAEMPTRGPTAGNEAGLYSASYWVGVDGAGGGGEGECDGGGGASLRAGVDTFWDGGLRSCNAWYQWAPGPAVDFADFAVGPGDVVRVTASAKGEGAGSVTVERLAGWGCNGNGTVVEASASMEWSGREASSPLCLAEAAWVVEVFALAGLPDVPLALANFSAVTFEDVGAATVDGEALDLAGARILNIDLEAQGGRLTDCAMRRDASVRCERVVGGV